MTIPRRIQLDKLTPVELAIVKAVNMVEALPADTRLTEAVVLLQQARDKVADYVDNVPATPSGYTGPIEVGMHFIWEPRNPQAWTHVEVIRIDPRPHGNEICIWTRVIHASRYNAAGSEAWNEESRFREACVRCDEKGVELSCLTNFV